MLDDTFHPSTIGGIKRLAKQLKKAKGVPHNKALNLAATIAGFENYTHAHKKLQAYTSIAQCKRLFFTVYWYDRKGDYKTGREVLEIELLRPLLEIASRNELKRSGAIGGFRLATPDHLVSDHVSQSQNEARNKICKAVRTLRFIEATGLKPSNDHDAAYPGGDVRNRLPKADHSTNWYDPDSGQFILIDEPYLYSEEGGERDAWAKKHNWHLKSSKWAGMYYPDMSTMFVATDASTGYDFQGLMAKIDGLPYPVTAERWEGISTKGHLTFYTPFTHTEQDKKRAVARGTIYREPSSKTAPMRAWNAPYNERRPNAIMSTDSHQYIARLIKAIESSGTTPIGVHDRLSTIKSQLEDWFFAEHESKVTNQFDLFYYGGTDSKDPYVIQARSVNGIISLLEDLKGQLLDAYVDCEPLRRMVQKVDASIKIVSKLI